VRMLNQGTGNWRHHPVSLASGALGNPALVDHANDLVADANMRTIGYETLREFTNFNFLDANRQRAWRMITDSLPGRQVTFQSATADFSKVVFYVEGNGYPRNYILYDATAGSLSQIGRAYPDITNQEMAEVHAIEYPAADGLTIPAYLTLPPGRGAQNLPLIVLPHGGPEGRDYAGFDWMAQALASRGYAVLQPNFRGSDGYDGAFIQAGYGEWGRKMQTDLSDGITFLASQGIVDASRVCIMGASYGGYAALAGVTLQSNIYRCAVAIAPVSDVGEFLEWRATRAGEDSSALRYWTRYLGVTDRRDPRLNEISTVRAARNGNAPVLLIHGRDDTVVPFDQSTDAESALRAAGRSVELIPLRAEDHYLSREPTRMQAMAAAVTFLERHNPPN
jgi:dipeptidyl aminopeptidase/acylaminoacyl peptidase